MSMRRSSDRQARCRALLARTQKGTGFRNAREETRAAERTMHMRDDRSSGTGLVSLSALRDRGWTGSMLRALIYKRSGDALQACRRGGMELWRRDVGVWTWR